MSKYKHNPLIAAMGLSVDGMESLTPEADTVTEVPEVIVDAEEQALEEAQQEIEKINTELMGVLEADANHEQSVAEAAEAIAGLESMFQGEFDEVVYRKHVGTLQAISERTEVPLPVTVDGMESLSSAQIYLNTMSGLEGFMDNLKALGKSIKETVIKVYNFLIGLVKTKAKEMKSTDKMIDDMIKELESHDGELKRTISLGPWYVGAEELYSKPGNTAHHKQLEGMIKVAGKIEVKEYMCASFDRACEMVGDIAKEMAIAFDDKGVSRSTPIIKTNIGQREVTFKWAKGLSSTEKELSVKVNMFVLGMTPIRLTKHKVGDEVESCFKSISEIKDMLGKLKTNNNLVEQLVFLFEKGLAKERDFLVAALNSENGVKRDPKGLIDIKQNLLSTALRINTEIVRSEISMVKAHLK